MAVMRNFSLLGCLVLFGLGVADLLVINLVLTPRYLAEASTPSRPETPKPAPAPAPESPKPETPKPETPKPAPAPAPAPDTRPPDTRPSQLALAPLIIQFRPGSSHLAKSQAKVLRKAARKLIGQPALTASLEGHADESGSESRNMALSLERANRVAKYLLQNRIAASRVTVRGHGASKPQVSGKTAKDLAKNRRVEIFLR